jgi:nucleotide-binding universal stress UspA family protein
MIRTLMLPLDGSRLGELARPIAVRLAERAKARLHIVMVHQPVAAVAGMGELPESFGAIDDESIHLHHIDGLAGPALCDEAIGVGADLIVMATHGRGALGRLWLGSVADYVVRHAGLPVLLVHASQRRGPPRNLPMCGILVALDLSKQAEAVLQPAVALARVEQAHLTLLHVVEPFDSTTGPRSPNPVLQAPEVTRSRCGEAQRYLDRIADHLREEGLSVSSRVVVGGNAAAALLAALDTIKYDVIAITTRGTGGLERVLVGGVADTVIRAASKPVLVLGPAAPH